MNWKDERSREAIEAMIGCLQNGAGVGENPISPSTILRSVSPADVEIECRFAN
jgi:hypothetical protein